MKINPFEGKSRTYTLLLTAIAGALGAMNYELFVFPNDFAPAGLGGICTLVQYIFNFSLGYMSLIINIPLVLFAYRTLEKKYAMNNLVYILAFSGASLLYRNIDFTSISFIAKD